MIFEQFYPTPEDLATKLAGLIEHPQPPILEPSAGTGNLLEAISRSRYGRSRTRFDERAFHCVELNPQRAAFLKDAGYPVVWNDFLTFDPLTPYQTIIMNPPFHDGAKHLLKALGILYDGGEIACILNAETIKNPFSRERQELIRQLEEMEVYNCEFVQSAFDGTDVEVALIYVKKADSTKRCVTFENFKESIVAERAQAEQQGLIRSGEINQLVDLYRGVVKSALHLFNDSLALNSLVKGDSSLTEIIELKNRYESQADIVKKINGIFWRKLLYSDELNHLLTNDAVRSYSAKLHEMAIYEFNERNILQLKADLTQNLFESIDDAIMKVWNNFTNRFSMTEYSQNIHYYNGWKTNKAFRCNKKVIIPLYAFDNWNKDVDLMRVQGELSDIEKAMNYLDNGRTDGSDMTERLRTSKDNKITRGIETKYFYVDVFKKGTCHLTFKDLDLLKKFNLYCGRKLNWLPDGYGSKPYEALDEDERAVADSFEGRESYQQTFANRQFYLQTSSPLMLTEGNKSRRQEI